MIILMCGLMGSGKSYEAVNYHIIPSLKSGRKVVTNIPLQIDYIVAVFGEQVRDLIVVIDSYVDDEGNISAIPFSEFDHFKDDWKHESKNIGALFVIDEAQIPLSKTESTLNKQVLAWATMQRHRGHDWILITQSPPLVYQPLLQLVTATHFFEKKTNIGKMDQYRHWVVDGYNLSKAFVLNKSEKSYDLNLFKYYKSHTQSDGAVDEQNIVGTHINIWKYLIPLFLGFAVFIGLIVYFYFYSIPNRYNNSVVESQTTDLNAFQLSNVEHSDVPISNVSTPLEPIKPVIKKVISKNIDHLEKSSEHTSIVDVKREVVVRDVSYSIDSHKRAPYDGFSFHISGSFVLAKKKSDIFYGVWSPDGVQDQVSREELLKLGYAVTVLNRCTHLFDHKYLKESFYVTCHAPVFYKDEDGKIKKDDPNSTMVSNISDQHLKKS